MAQVQIAPGPFTAKGKPIEITESAKPFKDAPEWAEYYVRFCDGSTAFYEHQPEIEWQHWFCNTGKQLKVPRIKPAYVPTWRKTIRKRPM